MNAAKRTINSTPMAPYAGLLRSMESSDMKTVILFLQDVLREREDECRAEDEFLAHRMAESTNALPEVFLKMRGSVTFSSEEIKSDDRLAYILNK